MAAAAAPPLPPSPPTEPDQRVRVSGVNWDQYCSLRSAFDELPAVRLTYREGELDIIVTSPEHERIKTMLARRGPLPLRRMAEPDRSRPRVSRDAGALSP